MKADQEVLMHAGGRRALGELVVGDLLKTAGREPFKVSRMVRGRADRWVRLQPENGAELMVPDVYWLPMLLTWAPESVMSARAVSLFDYGVDDMGAVAGVRLVRARRDGPDPSPIGPAELVRVRASIVDAADDWLRPCPSKAFDAMGARLFLLADGTLA